MNLTEDESRMQSKPIRMAFYGLAASELDLFTLVRSEERVSLVLVVDPGPMGIARTFAEIAGVQASGNAWDLPQAKLDWIVTGKIARTPSAPLERSAEGGAMVLDVAGATRQLALLEDSEAALERHGKARGALAEHVAEAPAEHVIEAPQGPDAGRATEEPAGRPVVLTPGPVPGYEEHIDERFAARIDWAPPEYELPVDEPPAAAKPAVAPVAPPVEEPAVALGEHPVPEPVVEVEMPRLAAKGPEDLQAATEGPARSSVSSTFLRPTGQDIETDRVVGWALEGLMSSVRSVWGVALTRARDDVCLVQRGIELESARPDLWAWLRKTIEGNGEGVGLISPPPDSGTLAWVPLRSDSILVGTVVLGRREDADPFSPSDQSWLQKVGERIASILCNTVSSTVAESAIREPSAPTSIWAAPVLERAAWARCWMKELLGANGCWLFAMMKNSSEPQLIDETWGSVSPPFLVETIRTAMERIEAQVWLDESGDKALVLQPLAPWGVQWTAVLEGVPWHGDGRATLARLKKAAATLSKLLKST